METTFSKDKTNLKQSIVYASKTGHSKKIAKAIAKELQITAQDIKSNPTMEGIDLLFIVGGIYASQSSPELIKYLEKLDNTMVKKVVLVTSCMSKIMKQEAIRKLLTEKNIKVAENEFTCQGSFLFFGLKHPNKTDTDNAITFAKQSMLECI